MWACSLSQSFKTLPTICVTVGQVFHLLPLGLSRFHCNLPHSELWSSATFAPRYHGLNCAPHVCPHRDSLPGEAHYHQVTYISVQSDEERKGLVTWNLLNSEKDRETIKESNCFIQFLKIFSQCILACMCTLLFEMLF